MTRDIIPIVACIVRSKGEILLLKRAKPPYRGMWSLVGGKIEQNEHPKPAAIRETLEETGLRCKKIQPRGIFSEVLHLANGETRHFLAFLFEIEPTSKKFGYCNEGELRWFKQKDWHTLRSTMIPSDWQLVKKALSEKPRLHIHEVKVVQRVKNGTEIYSVESIV